MQLYNTLTQRIEKFTPLHDNKATFYSCGPTVYDFAHIGHIRRYITDDLLKRVLKMQGYHVTHVMNVTDVGHLSGDDDTGEDKLEKGAAKQKKTVWEVAKFFTDYFFYSMKEVGVLPADIVCKATDHIPDMVDLIKTLYKKEYVYETDEALYFDTSRFASYGALTNQRRDEKLVGVRDEVIVDAKKRHPADFSVWFKRTGRFVNHTMHWGSPWGEGFPGWHIECSAMSMKYLGQTIDIHSGGVDHIAVHHTNEIAQSEAATSAPFVKYWVHSEFLTVEGKKMSKSLDNFYTIDDIKKKHISPFSLRFLFLQSHYRTQMNFTWEALYSANEGYVNLKKMVEQLKIQTKRQVLSEEKLSALDEYRARFISACGSDLQIPQAIAVMYAMLKSNIPSSDKYDLVCEFDEVLGLRLGEVEEMVIPDDIQKLKQERDGARLNKAFGKADSLRDEIEEKGFILEDQGMGTVIKQK